MSSRLQHSLTTFALCVFLTLPVWASERQSLEVGHASNEIPLAQLEKIAIDEARSIWGTVTAGPAIPIDDVHGDVIAYDIVFILGQKTFPDDNEILSKVQNAKSICQNKAEKRALSDTYKNALQAQWGVGEYGTITMGARTDVFPVLECYSGLPRYYTTLDASREIAAKELEANSPVLKRIVAAGKLDKWYEFKHGNNSVYVNMYSQKTIDAVFINTLKSQVSSCDIRPAYCTLSGGNYDSPFSGVSGFGDFTHP